MEKIDKLDKDYLENINGGYSVYKKKLTLGEYKSLKYPKIEYGWKGGFGTEKIGTNLTLEDAKDMAEKEKSKNNNETFYIDGDTPEEKFELECVTSNGNNIYKMLEMFYDI